MAFLDILGFKDFIKKAEVPNSKEYQQLCKLDEVIKAELVVDDFHPKWKPTCTHISDSIILSGLIDNDGYKGLTAISIKTIQISHQLLKMGFLLRGGIAVGNVAHTRENIFGTGYVDAYLTQENSAITPRVLLHQSAVEHIKNSTLSCWLTESNEWIVDTLNPHKSYIPIENPVELFNEYRQTINSKLNEYTCGSAIRSKWEWMANFFNAELLQYGEIRYQVEPITLAFPSSPFRKEILEKLAREKEDAIQCQRKGESPFDWMKPFNAPTIK